MYPLPMLGLTPQAGPYSAVPPSLPPSPSEAQHCRIVEQGKRKPAAEAAVLHHPCPRPSQLMPEATPAHLGQHSVATLLAPRDARFFFSGCFWLQVCRCRFASCFLPLPRTLASPGDGAQPGGGPWPQSCRGQDATWLCRGPASGNWLGKQQQRGLCSETA